MALRLAARRRVRRFMPALAAASAAFLSFQFFEDVYAALEESATSFAVNETARPDARAQSTLAGWGTKLIRTSVGVGRAQHDSPGEEDAGARLVTLRANRFGHFNVTALIEGKEVELMTDTGATYVALTYETAAKLGYRAKDLRFSSESETANGIARVAPIVLREVRVGAIVVHDVQAVVAEPGKMSQNLLGMSFINRLSRFEVSGHKLTLTQ